MFTTTTPYMDLVLPIPTEELGPAWATELNAALTLVDSHDHTPGQGVPVPVSAILFNQDFSVTNFDITNIRATRFTNQGSPLSTPADLTELYVSGGNLWYNNQIGQQVQITAGNALNAGSIGGIGGDYISSGALVYYTSLDGEYSFTSAGNLYASMQQGATTIFPTGTNTFGVTLQAPNSLAADYSLTLPTGLPSSTSTLNVSPAGVLSFGSGVPSGTILAYGGTTAPGGYLMCDGTSYLQSAYPNLFAAIGTAYGSADSAHFNVPDMRGYFPRGVDNGSGHDPNASSRTALNTGGNTGNNVGSYQADQVGPISISFPGAAGGTAGLSAVITDTGGTPVGTFTNISTSAGAQTQPRNVYVNFIIAT